MKMKFRGPATGQPFAVRVGTRSASVTEWGVRPTVAPSSLTRTAWNGRTNVLDLRAELGADTVVATAVSAGRFTNRADGRITLDLTKVRGTEPIALAWEARKGAGAPVAGSCTVTIPQDTQITGTRAVTRWWGEGRHYVFPVNAQDEYVFEKHPTAGWVIHVSQDPSALTRAAIAALEGVAETVITPAWLKANTARGKTVRYGETPELALAEDLAESIRVGLCSGKETAFHFLFRRGDTFPLFHIGSVVGHSFRYPIVFGSYGTGAWPKLTLRPSLNRKMRYIALQNLWIEPSDGGVLGIIDGEFIIFDGIRAHCEVQASRVGNAIRGITWRRIINLDAFKATPGATSTEADGTVTWALHGNRTSGFYATGGDGMLVEKVLCDHAGWGDGYAYDCRAEFPQPPSMYSQGMYLQYSINDLTVRDVIVTRASSIAIQQRSGGITERVLLAGNNGGLLTAGVIGDDDGNFSYVADLWVTQGGMKATAKEKSLYLAGGVDASTPLTTLDAVVVAHRGDMLPPGEFGPCGPQWQTYGSSWPLLNFGDDGTTYSNPQFVGYSWGGRENILPEGANTSLMATATLAAWLDARLGAAGHEADDLYPFLRGLAAPWAEIKGILDWALPRYGFARGDRTAATTLRFAPVTDGRTPGMRADIRRDWSTGDLPGTVAGDSIDLDGHKVNWHLNPAHPVVNLDLGGGELVMWGGDLKPTGALTGGGKVSLRYRSDLWINGHADAARLAVEVLDAGRFVNRGAVIGPVDLTARANGQAVLAWEGASFTLTSGSTLMLEGVTAGFDGTAGGAASVALQAGSTTRLRPGLTLPFTDPAGRSGQFWVGGTIRGLTSGATATVLGYVHTDSGKGYLTLGDVTGSFAVGETLNGPLRKTFNERGAEDLGVVAAAGTVTIPKIGKLPAGPGTGRVAATVTLGGTLDLSALPPGTHTIVEADTVSGSFAAVIGGSVSTATAGKVIATVA